MLTRYNLEIEDILFDDASEAEAAAAILRALGGAGEKPKRPLEKLSEAKLRQHWRADEFDEATWQAELEARGYSAQQALQEIATQKNTGVSTAAKTRGQLTDAEAADVEAIKGVPRAAPPMNTAASATASGQAGGNAFPQNGGGSSLATAESSGVAGGDAVAAPYQPSSPSAGRTPGGQGSSGGGSQAAAAPAKPKPIRRITQDDGSRIWAVDSGKRDAEGEIIWRQVQRPQAPASFSGIEPDSDRGYVYDAGSQTYRPVHWNGSANDNAGEWEIDFDPKKASERPVTIGRSSQGEALVTGKDVSTQPGREGQSITPYGMQNAPATEGFQQTGSLGGGATNIVPGSIDAFLNLDPAFLAGIASGEVSSLGVPETNGQLGLSRAGLLAGGVSQFVGPGGGIGQDNKQIIAAYGGKVSPNEAVNAGTALRIQNRKAELLAAGLGQAETQKRIGNEEGNNVSVPEGFKVGRGGSLLPPSASAQFNKHGPVNAAIPNVEAPWTPDYQEYANGGEFMTPGPIGFVDLRTGRLMGVAGEREAEKVSIRDLTPGKDPASMLASRPGVRRFNDGGDFVAEPWRNADEYEREQNNPGLYNTSSADDFRLSPDEYDEELYNLGRHPVGGVGPFAGLLGADMDDAIEDATNATTDAATAAYNNRQNEIDAASYAEAGLAGPAGVMAMQGYAGQMLPGVRYDQESNRPRRQAPPRQEASGNAAAVNQWLQLLMGGAAMQQPGGMGHGGSMQPSRGRRR